MKVASLELLPWEPRACASRWNSRLRLRNRPSASTRAARPSPNTIACSAEVTKDCLPKKPIKSVLCLFSGLVGVPWIINGLVSSVFVYLLFIITSQTNAIMRQIQSVNINKMQKVKSWSMSTSCIYKREKFVRSGTRALLQNSRNWAKCNVTRWNGWIRNSRFQLASADSSYLFPV